MDTSEVIIKAAGLLVERGHCKGAYRESDGSLCASAAINVAAGCEPNGLNLANPDGARLARQSRRAMSRWLHKQGHIPYDGGLTYWNDVSKRTKDEVVTAFRECAAEMGEEAGR